MMRAEKCGKHSKLCRTHQCLWRAGLVSQRKGYLTKEQKQKKELAEQHCGGKTGRKFVVQIKGMVYLMIVSGDRPMQIQRTERYSKKLEHGM